MGKVALITGGASGIGRATAHRLAGDGATVVIADVDEVRAKAVADELEGDAVALDVTDGAAWAAAVATVRQRHGGLDIAHLNAGVATKESDPAEISDDEYRRVMTVNVDGVVFGIRACVPAMRERGGGAIVVTASLGGLVPMPMDPVYSLTKHAVVAYVRSCAPVLSEHRITINAICPGFTDTPLVTAEAREFIAQAIGAPLMDPEQIAEGVAAIIADGSTGQAWFCQPGRGCAPYAFRGVPGPRT